MSNKEQDGFLKSKKKAGKVFLGLEDRQLMYARQTNNRALYGDDTPDGQVVVDNEYVLVDGDHVVVT